MNPVPSPRGGTTDSATANVEAGARGPLATRSALRLAAGHWLIAFAVQFAEASMIAPGGGRALLVVRLPLLQLENAAVALLLGAVARRLIRRSLSALALLLFLLCNAWVLADQIVYKLFFHHVQRAMLDDLAGARSLASSAAAEIDRTFIVSAIVVVALSVFVLRGFTLGAPPPPTWLMPLIMRRRRPLLLAVACFAVASVVTQARFPHHDLAHHPIAALASSFVAHLRRPPTFAARVRDLRSLRFGAPTADDGDALGRARDALADGHPNVVLFVLESVGARQLFDAGAPPAEVAPALRALFDHGLLFDTVYTVHPSTTRSTVALVYGGATVTIGNILRDLTLPYHGPTLPGTLAAQGWDTGLFSAADLAFENLGAALGQAGYRTVFDFGAQPEAFRRGAALNSWGGRDDVIAREAASWMGAPRSPARPFFLHFITNATHHPYDTPPAFAPPPGFAQRTAGLPDEKRNHLRALAYVDAALRALLDEIDRRGLADETLVAITGDHGESFAEWHEENLMHRNFLYEENVRTFLLLARGRRLAGPVISHRAGTVGDILPTIVTLAGGAPPAVQGQDLLAPSWTPRIAYFQKNADPPDWGLRDGRWKFIGAQDGERAQLFDLESDPTEQHDVAAAHRDMTALYRDMCASWLVRSQDDFTAQLDDGARIGVRPLTEAEQATPGARRLAFGRFVETAGGREFVEQRPGERFRPDDRVGIWTRWSPFGEDQSVRLEWRAPSGRSGSREFTLHAGDMLSQSELRSRSTLGTGTWRVSLWRGEALMRAGTFEVGP